MALGEVEPMSTSSTLVEMMHHVTTNVHWEREYFQRREEWHLMYQLCAEV